MREGEFGNGAVRYVVRSIICCIGYVNSSLGGRKRGSDGRQLAGGAVDGSAMGL